MIDHSPEWIRVFGPVPSRRLGQSIGINNIPPKICSYACVYCQVGQTHQISNIPKAYYSPDSLLKEVQEKLSSCEERGEHVDALTVVSDGEPTLDKNLGILLKHLKMFGLKTAVITNGSLINIDSVKDVLMGADWVSIKIDSVLPSIWRKMNRPSRNIDLISVLKAIKKFSDLYKGELHTETMLVKGLNDSLENIEHTASFIGNLQSAVSYISIPTRPTAEKSISAPEENRLNEAWQIFSSYHINTELLIGYEGNAFAWTGDAREDILSITSVHPMKEEAVRMILSKAGEHWSMVQNLLNEQLLVKIRHKNDIFYIRQFKRNSKHNELIEN